MEPSNHKPFIHGVVVVEGKTDTDKLRSLFELETLETHGYQCSSQMIKTLQTLAKHQPIIILTDPDQPGNYIRSIVSQALDQFSQCYITKQDMQPGSKKLGVAEAKPEVLVQVLTPYISDHKPHPSLTWNQYLELGLVSHKAKRFHLCKSLNIAYSNNKQLFKRLNLLQLTTQEIQELMDYE